MNERQNQKQNLKLQSKRKKRGASVAAVLCFVAAIAIVGTYTFKDYRKSQLEQQAKLEESAKAEAANAQDIVNSDVKEEKEELVQQEEKNILEETIDMEEVDTAGEAADGTEETTNHEVTAKFDQSDKLLWPVEGHLLMNYSMDKTVYFSTLDQFKYNPALVISGEKGDQVISSAPGIVKSIDKTAETGTTVNVDLGGGYELFYGQLSDVQVKTGDKVNSKTVLGYVGDPTMYYSREGSNVYFEMRKDGQPVDPMDYLVE